MPAQYFGKYRGKVANNIDPMQLGRLQVTAPAVLGEGRMSWAMPCTPYAGSSVGFFAIPPVGANVWVEFEGGDPDYPIWSGCFWGTGEVPASPALPQMKVFKTDGITLTLSDMPGAGGLTIEVQPPVVGLPLKMTFDASGVKVEASPATVTIAPAGIELTDNPSTLKVSPVNVSINNGALEVM
jgi:Type VI secretion system/phage-baseplate injector OB domain